jgi:hypothetical protein
MIKNSKRNQKGLRVVLTAFRPFLEEIWGHHANFLTITLSKYI